MFSHGKVTSANTRRTTYDHIFIISDAFVTSVVAKPLSSCFSIGPDSCTNVLFLLSVVLIVDVVSPFLDVGSTKMVLLKTTDDDVTGIVDDVKFPVAPDIRVDGVVVFIIDCLDCRSRTTAEPPCLPPASMPVRETPVTSLTCLVKGSEVVERQINP